MLSRFVKYIVRSIDRHCNEPSILFHGLNSVGFIFFFFFFIYSFISWPAINVGNLLINVTSRFHLRAPRFIVAYAWKIYNFTQSRDQLATHYC